MPETDKKKSTKKTKKQQIPAFVEGMPAKRATAKVNIGNIILEDDTFKYRTYLKTADLEKSIKIEGQQIPILLRPHPTQKKKYQIISGFRRVTAIKNIGWKYVNAIIRDDVKNDFDALKISVIENEIRKSYTKSDRALAVVKARRAGRKWKELESLFGMSRMQLSRLQALTRLPEELKKALDKETITETQAVILASHKDKQKDLDLLKWIKKITEEKLSVRKLEAELNKEYKNQEKPLVVFDRAEDDNFQLRRVKLKLGDKEAIKQLEELLSILKSKV